MRLQNGRLLRAEEACAAIRGFTCAAVRAICDRDAECSTDRNKILIRYGNNIELGVGLERVASIGLLGSIKYDGYFASAYKRKMGSLRLRHAAE